ncbi:MAG: hypothetical protein K2N27_08335, partial [Ruminococcus sp.]|nr:hypothetical protein [Ruminococcus sp.]
CYNILNYCNGDEHKALNCFFDFYDKFCEVKAEYFIKSVLTQENISCNNNKEYAYQVINDQKCPIYTAPLSVYFVKLNFSAYLTAIETKKNIVCERRLFTSIERAMEEISCFGKIELGNKNTKSIEFEKNIIIG